MPAEIAMLQLVRAEAEERGDPVPFDAFYNDPGESAQQYDRLRRLEDLYLVAFTFEHAEDDPHGNQRQFVSLTDNGKQALLAALEAREGGQGQGQGQGE